VIRPPVDVDEVHHRSRRDPIDQVARGAADDQREADARRKLVMAEVGQVHADRDEGRRRDDGNDHDLEREVGRVEKAERGTRIAHVRQVQKPRHDGHAGVQREHLPDQRFRQLIGRDDCQRQPDLESSPRQPRSDRVGRWNIIHESVPPGHPGSARTVPPRPDRWTRT
jgi:hypothetical protein